MNRTFSELCEELKKIDETTLLELLEISSEEIVNKFEDKSEDRLDLLAEQFYGDTELWWIITIANLGKIKRDSFFVKGGLQIRIPQDTQSVIDEYKRINS